jgi:chitin synthase
MISRHAASRADNPDMNQTTEPVNEQAVSLLHSGHISALSLGPFADPISSSQATRTSNTSSYTEVKSPDADFMESQDIPDQFKLHNLSNQGSAVSSSKDSGARHKGSSIRRYPTRRIKLIQGSVLSINYPVPSPIRNAIQPQYRDAEGELSEEFTQMRCKVSQNPFRPNTETNLIFCARYRRDVRSG